MEKVKIGAADIMQVTPDPRTWRTLPLVDPKQPGTVSASCSRLNTENPDLPYSFRMRRNTEDKTFTVYAKPKKVQP